MLSSLISSYYSVTLANEICDAPDIHQWYLQFTKKPSSSDHERNILQILLQDYDSTQYKQPEHQDHTIKAIKKLLDAKVKIDIDHVDINKDTILHYAARAGIKPLALILAYKPDVQLANKKGIYAIEEFITYCSFEEWNAYYPTLLQSAPIKLYIKLLNIWSNRLLKSAAPNVAELTELQHTEILLKLANAARGIKNECNIPWQTIINSLIQHEYWESCLQLLRNKFLSNIELLTLLYCATIHQKNSLCIELLEEIEAGSLGQFAEHQAFIHGLSELPISLIEKYEEKKLLSQADYNELLKQALHSNNIQLLQWSLQKDAKATEYFYIALECAVTQSYNQCLQTLPIEMITACECTTSTYLTFAIYHHNIEFAEYYIANNNEATLKKINALIFAMEHKIDIGWYPDFCKKLLSIYDITAVNQFHKNPLILAIENHLHNSINVMLDYLQHRSITIYEPIQRLFFITGIPSDIQQVDKLLFNSLTKNDAQGVTEALLNYNQDNNGALQDLSNPKLLWHIYYAIHNKHLEAITALNIDLSNIIYQNRSVLMYAAEIGWREMIDYLLTREYHPSNNPSPLFSINEKGQDIMVFLLCQKIDVAKQLDIYGPILFYMWQYNHSRWPDYISLAKQYNLTESYSWLVTHIPIKKYSDIYISVMQSALEGNHTELLQTLIKYGASVKSPSIFSNAQEILGFSHEKQYKDIILHTPVRHITSHPIADYKCLKILLQYNGNLQDVDTLKLMQTHQWEKLYVALYHNLNLNISIAQSAQWHAYTEQKQDEIMKNFICSLLMRYYKPKDSNRSDIRNLLLVVLSSVQKYDLTLYIPKEWRGSQEIAYLQGYLMLLKEINISDVQTTILSLNDNNFSSYLSSLTNHNKQEVKKRTITI